MRDQALARRIVMVSGLTVLGVGSMMLQPEPAASHGATQVAMVFPIHRRYAYHCHRRRGYRRWCHQGARRWRNKTPRWQRRRREERSLPAWPQPHPVAPGRYRSI